MPRLGDRRFFFAVAIEAAVGGADTARHRHLLPQRLARAVHPNRGIVGRNRSFTSQVVQTPVVEIDGLQRLLILRLDRAEQTRHALANLALEDIVRFLVCFQVVNQPLGQLLR